MSRKREEHQLPDVDQREKGVKMRMRQMVVDEVPNKITKIVSQRYKNGDKGQMIAKM